MASHVHSPAWTERHDRLHSERLLPGSAVPATGARESHRPGPLEEGSMKPTQEDVFEAFAREFIRRHRDAPPPWSVERILVATDFSFCSLSALEHAEELARKLDAELLLLHVEVVPVAGSKMADVTHAAAERELARTTEQLRNHHLKVRSLLRMGAPDEEILNAAGTEQASLIVMGTHDARASRTCSWAVSPSALCAAHRAPSSRWDSGRTGRNDKSADKFSDVLDTGKR